MVSILKEESGRLYLIQARAEAEELGAPKSANMILLGKLLSIKPILSEEIVEGDQRCIGSEGGEGC